MRVLLGLTGLDATVIVFDNGKSGFNGEHSCMDGTPTSRLNDWLLRSLDAGKVPLGDSARGAGELPAVKALEFKLPQQVMSTITEAVTTHAETMAKHELAVLQYDGYGKDVIKSFKISPDSYTQLVMGLAYYKMTGHAAPTYESAQTRKFKLGRTEVIRSTIPDALAFYKAMEDPSRTDEERLVALQKAGAAHIKLAGEAADGRGVDRHLFGEWQRARRLARVLTSARHDRFEEAAERGRASAGDLHGPDILSVEQLGFVDVSADVRVL